MRPRQFTDEELLEAARRCFLRDGPGVSTATIAAELGVSPPALFRRVGTKEELMRRALSVPYPPRWLAVVERGPTEADVRSQLVELGLQIAEFFAALMPAMATLRASGLGPQEVFADCDVPPPVRAAKALGRWFRTLAEQRRIATDRPEAVAVAFLGCLQSQCMVRHFVGNTYPDGGPGYVQAVVDLFLDGIGTPGSTPDPAEDAQR